MFGLDEVKEGEIHEEVLALDPSIQRPIKIKLGQKLKLHIAER